ncbi:MAG: hypothetical protein M1820_004778 [Bogoriella megaspora]|nr:MAG: hypothetical protein M1820_004778 [Bogoriella megaspora]
MFTGAGASCGVIGQVTEIYDAVFTEKVTKVQVVAKLPSRSQDKALRDAFEPGEYSPPLQAVSVRYPPLSPKTEYQLRQACASLARDYKPSHHALQPQPQRPQHRSKGERSHIRIASDPPHTETDGGLTELDMLEPSKFSYRPNADLKDLLGEPSTSHHTLQANIGRRRESPGTSSEGPRPKERRQSYTASSQSDAKFTSQTKPKVSAGAESFETEASTPHTGSSEIPWTTSTAATSEAMTPARTSKRESNQQILSDQEVASRADEAAVEWMRIEKEKRNVQEPKKEVFSQQQQQQQLPEHAPTQAHFKTPADNVSRPPSRARSSSRARSIKDAVQNYIRPGVPPSSRSASRESFRSLKTDRKRSPQGFHWRSWSLTRNKSARQESRPGSRDGRSSGRDENTRGRSAVKPEINLNRELPPLPSLDNWQEPEPEPAAPSAHIASLMRPSGDSLRPRSRPLVVAANEVADVSLPTSPTDTVPGDVPSPLRLTPKSGATYGTGALPQTRSPPHYPPRTSSRNDDGHVKQSTSTSIPVVSPSASQARSPVVSQHSRSSTTVPANPRSYTLMPKLRSPSQSSAKSPSIPSQPSRPGTRLEGRHDEFDMDDLVPESQTEETRGQWFSKQLQGGGDFHTLTHTKTVGVTSSLASPNLHTSEKDSISEQDRGSGRSTGLRQRSATAAPFARNTNYVPANNVDNRGEQPRGLGLGRKISRHFRPDDRSDDTTGEPEPFFPANPAVRPPTSSHGGKNIDTREGDNIRLKSKFARFFNSSGSHDTAGTKPKPRKKGEGSENPTVANKVAGKSSPDPENAAPSPGIGYRR